MGDLQRKNALVLGASTPGGMGEAIARRLRKEGAEVVVSARNANHLETLARDIGVTEIPADITDSAQIRALIDRTTKLLGRLDIVINAVGRAPRVPIREFTEAHLLEMARLHFVGPAMLIKHAAEALVEGGALVNISSLCAYDALSGIVGYAASKCAGDRIIQGAAIEYRNRRLRINGLVPSLVLTELSRQGMRNYGADPEAFERSYADLTPLGRIATVADIAAMACMMVRDEYFETGQIVFCTGGNALLGQPRTLA